MIRAFTTREFITNAEKIHGQRYNYVDVEYINTATKIKIWCQKHGSFLQTPHSHIQGHGCPKCKVEVVKSLHQKNSNDFIKSAHGVHGNLYDYSESVYTNCNKKIKIICKKHGEFVQTPNSHVNHRQGCPKCIESKGECEIRRFLEINNIKYESQKKFDDCRNPKTKFNLKFDFYIPSKNILIEYDGQQHTIINPQLRKYKFTQKDLDGIRYRDGLKSDYARTHKIKLIRIDHNSFTNISLILNKELL